MGEVVEVLVGNELGILFPRTGARPPFLEALVLGHELGVATEQNIVARPAMLVETVTAFLLMPASRS